MRIIPFLIPVLFYTMSIADEADSLLYHLSVNGPVSELCHCIFKCSSLNIRRSDGLTPLLAAVQANNRSTVTVLLEHGADASIHDALNFDALYWALHKGFFPVADVLLAHGVDVDRANAQGNSPLISAVMRGDLAMATYLLQRGADRMRKSAAGLTALDIATQNHHKSMINLLSSFTPVEQNVTTTQSAETGVADAPCSFTDAKSFYAAVQSGRRCFMSCSLMGIDLMGMRLSGINFHGANLSGCDLRNADMRYCDLSCATLRNSFLHGADLRYARVDKTDFGNTMLTRCDLRETVGLSFEQLRSALNLYKAKIDSESIEIMQRDYPKLFKNPGGAWNYQVKAALNSQ